MDILEFISARASQLREELEGIHSQYEDGQFYSNDDSSMQDYLEGAIGAYETILAKYSV